MAFEGPKDIRSNLTSTQLGVRLEILRESQRWGDLKIQGDTLSSPRGIQPFFILAILNKTTGNENENGNGNGDGNGNGNGN